MLLGYANPNTAAMVHETDQDSTSQQEEVEQIAAKVAKTQDPIPAPDNKDAIVKKRTPTPSELIPQHLKDLIALRDSKRAIKTTTTRDVKERNTSQEASKDPKNEEAPRGEPVAEVPPDAHMKAIDINMVLSNKTRSW